MASRRSSRGLDGVSGRSAAIRLSRRCRLRMERWPARWRRSKGQAAIPVAQEAAPDAAQVSAQVGRDLKRQCRPASQTCAAPRSNRRPRARWAACRAARRLRRRAPESDKSIQSTMQFQDPGCRISIQVADFMGRARLEHRLRAKAEATIQPGLALRRLTAWASTVRCLRACRRSSSRPSLQNRRLARLRLGAQRQEDQRQRHEYHHHQLVSALVGMRPRVVHEGLQLGRLLLEEDLLDVDWIETFSCSAGGGQRGYAHLGLARTRRHALSCDLRLLRRRLSETPLRSEQCPLTCQSPGPALSRASFYAKTGSYGISTPRLW
jgi:hypothetical protein